MVPGLLGPVAFLGQRVESLSAWRPPETPFEFVTLIVNGTTIQRFGFSSQYLILGLYEPRQAASSP